MSKLKSNILFQTLCFLAALSLYNSCQTTKYAKGVLEDNQNLIEYHKSFIRSIEFTGTLKKKIEDKGKYGRRILIEMDTFFVKEVQFNPYYSIKENEIDIVVSKELYDSVTISDTLFKKKGSLDLKINNKDIPLVSSEKYIWLQNK